MPRKTLPFSSSFAVHIVARTLNREPFKAPIESVWQIMENYLSLVAKMYNLKIYSFVLMPNHFHLLIRPVEDNLGAALNYAAMKTRVSRPSKSA